ncbi:hypothetical protein MASR2M54_26440 [Aliarcobacter cryaerophilus]
MKSFIDLAKEGNRYNLPFVFARFKCYNKYESRLKKLTKNFDKKRDKNSSIYFRAVLKKKWYFKEKYFGLSYKN